MTIAEKKRIFSRWGYGLFIHYGLYSTYGLGEWMMFLERRDAGEYYREALPHFKPRKGCAEEWVELAVRGGMRYAVLTTRHHEGYFVGEELLHEFVNACRAHELGIGFYYSVADWSDPDYCVGPRIPESWERFVRKTHRQIREIMTGYGKIDYLFYDGCPPPETWRLRELHREIRAIQPEMLISRCVEDVDLKSCEGHANGDPERLWESCYTMQPCWGYNKNEPVDKTPAQVAKMLSDNRHNGGNLLLNIGPMADGTVPPDQREIIETVGKWVKTNQEALFDVEPHPFRYYDREITTSNGNIAYMRLVRMYGPERRIGGIGNRIRRITFLDNGREIMFQQKDDVVTLYGMPEISRNDMPRFIRIELDGPPIGIRNPKNPDCSIKTTGE